MMKFKTKQEVELTRTALRLLQIHIEAACVSPITAIQQCDILEDLINRVAEEIYHTDEAREEDKQYERYLPPSMRTK